MNNERTWEAEHTSKGSSCWKGVSFVLLEPHRSTAIFKQQFDDKLITSFNLPVPEKLEMTV